MLLALNPKYSHLVGKDIIVVEYEVQSETLNVHPDLSGIGNKQYKVGVVSNYIDALGAFEINLPINLQPDDSTVHNVNLLYKPEEDQTVQIPSNGYLDVKVTGLFIEDSNDQFAACEVGYALAIKEGYSKDVTLEV